ncbi:ornithine cyclodeaminase/mu-crystallin family protein [Penicillium malachiteum]|uniref:ornithine cyclodeaminase/mu-crystallin family protein n=1 Tax=Penicillium malachiteum TaxID=1324776 RepID=UPI002548C5B8|nr:ornithine cyclodeaminase/mu-crystallin family protein [Penicillium malachiteum]KAJ5720723.1 ornithine cyclodeaminase/mu-crystallin family protein [Penicillium malachiteum]
MLILSDKNVQEILYGLSRKEWAHLLQIFSQFMTEYSAEPSKVFQPSRARITTSLGHNSLFMPASNTLVTGIKSMTIPGDGSSINGSVSICKPTGELEGLLNARELTAFRTSLAANIIFSRRMWDGAENIVIFGAGKQAEWHLRIALLIGPAAGTIGKVTIVNRSQSALDKFEQGVFADLRPKYPTVVFESIVKTGNPGHEEQIKSALQDAAVVFACTPSVEPLFPYSYLQNSEKKKFSEVDKATILSGKLLCVDSKEECMVEAGELIMGNVSQESLTEIGALLPLDDDDERVQILKHENVVFKCVGMGIMDVAIGTGVLELAKKKHIGVELSDF